MVPSTKAIILAAGYGTRLKPLTEVLPKALVPLLGSPLVRHSITRLLQSGISSIGINTHHHADKMQRFISEQHDCPLHVSHEPAILGSAGGIGGFREFLADEDYFIVDNADSVSNIGCDQFLPEFLRHGPLVTMVLTDHPGSNNVCIDANLAITDLRDILHPQHTVARLTYTGMAYMSRDFLDHIPPGASELVPLLLELIKQRPGCVRAAIARNAAWRDIGTLGSYLKAHREILIERRPLIPESCIPSGNLQIGEHSFLADDCIFEGFLAIGRNCRIEPGCRLRDCVIWDNTSIPAGTKLFNAVCAQGTILNA